MNTGGKILDCYVLREKVLNGTFNHFHTANDFDAAHFGDEEDTPRATRNFIDDATSLTVDNVKAFPG